MTLPLKPEVVKDKDVLISDDLRDGGHTLEFVSNMVKIMGDKSIKILVMGDKEDN